MVVLSYLANIQPSRLATKDVQKAPNVVVVSHTRRQPDTEKQSLYI